MRYQPAAQRAARARLKRRRVPCLRREALHAGGGPVLASPRAHAGQRHPVLQPRRRAHAARELRLRARRRDARHREGPQVHKGADRRCASLLSCTGRGATRAAAAPRLRGVCVCAGGQERPPPVAQLSPALLTRGVRAPGVLPARGRQPGPGQGAQRAERLPARGQGQRPRPRPAQEARAVRARGQAAALRGGAGHAGARLTGTCSRALAWPCGGKARAQAKERQCGREAALGGRCGALCCSGVRSAWCSSG